MKLLNLGPLCQTTCGHRKTKKTDGVVVHVAELDVPLRNWPSDQAAVQ